MLYHLTVVNFLRAHSEDANVNLRMSTYVPGLSCGRRRYLITMGCFTFLQCATCSGFAHGAVLSDTSYERGHINLAC